MSETAPTYEVSKEATQSDDQREIERLEAQIAKKQFELKQNDAFGKYDPAEIGPINKGEHSIHRGEYSHETYHAQRPSEGIIRDGNVFRQAGGTKAGDFASEADYDAQTGATRVNTPKPTEEIPNPEGWTYHEDEEASANRYYDKLIDGDKQQEVATVPEYENMSIQELAIASAKANILGDKAEADDIHAVFEHLLMEAATDPESGTEATDADYQKEIERFDHLVELAMKQQEAKNPDVVAANKIAGNAESPAEANSEDADPTVTAETPKTPQEEEEEEEEEEEDADDAETSETTKAEKAGHNAGETAVLDGKEVTLGESFVLQNGATAYEIINADGSKGLLAYEEQLSFPESEEKKESAVERAKSFWKKGKDYIAKTLTMGYMGAKWFIDDSIINRGIDPMTTNFEEAEKIKHRRRIALVAGTAAVLVLLAVTKDIHGFGGGNNVHAADVPLPTDTPTPSSSTGTENHFSEFLKPQGDGPVHTPELNPNDPAYTLTPVDQAPAVTSPDVASAIDPSFSVGRGEGGLELFSQLGIDPSKWAANAARLAQQHPEDFYQMNGGGIGLTHSGLLSEATRIDLANIKQS